MQNKNGDPQRESPFLYYLIKRDYSLDQSILVMRTYLFCLNLFPKCFFFPFLGESHCCDVHIGVLVEQIFQVCFHFMTWCDDVEKPFENADVIKYSFGRNWWWNPYSIRLLYLHRHNGIFFVPNSWMVATWIPGQCYDCHPRTEYRCR